MRSALGRTICRQYQEEDGKLHVAPLDTTVEKIMQESVEQASRGMLPPSTVSRVVSAISRETEKMVSSGHAAVLICSPPVRPAVRRLCESSNLQVAVLSYGEVPREVQVQSVGFVTLAEAAQPVGAAS